MESSTRTGHAKLRELHGLLELMSIILRQFTSIDHRDFDDAVQVSLAAIGRFTGVDRSYIFLAEDDIIHNTHEWCAPGIEPEIDNLQQVPVETISWWWKPRLQRGQPVYIPSVSDLPDQRASERELLAGQGIQSLIVMPLIGPDDELHGFIGFDSVRQKRVWEEPAKLLLRAVADIIIGALVRRDTFVALQQSEQRFRTLVRRSPDVMMILDAELQVRYLGPAGRRLLGWAEDPQAQRDYLHAVHPNDRPLVQAGLQRAAEAKGDYIRIRDHRLSTADYGYIWCQATASDLGDDPAVAGILITAQDISRRKVREHDLREGAMTDALTGLPNRALLGDRLQQMLLQAQRFADHAGVLLLDIDRFQQARDEMVVRDSEHILQTLAKQLQQGLSPGETVARFDDNAFAVLLYDRGAPETGTMLQTAERFRNALSTPMALPSGKTYPLSLSAGLALDTGYKHPRQLIRDAETAMTQAKHKGGARLLLSRPKAVGTD